MQMLAVVSTADLESIRQVFPGTTQERMLRQIAEAVEIATQHRGLLLWLEDLHWSDRPTLDWLAFVARRRETARLLVIATHRPVDVIIHAHPLRTISHELRMHEECQDLPLTLLIENAAAIGVGQAYARGRELCLQIGATPELFPALSGLHTFHMVRAELKTARELRDQIAVLAQDQADTALMQFAHMFLAESLFWKGDFTEAQEHLESGIAMRVTQKTRRDVVRAKQAICMMLLYGAATLWHLGA